MSKQKSYLGDAVYVDVDEYNAIVLTTEDGYKSTNRIVLEPEVMDALLSWYARLSEKS